MRRILSLTFASFLLGFFVAENASALRVTGVGLLNYSTAVQTTVTGESQLNAGAIGAGGGFLIEFVSETGSGLEFGTLLNVRRASGRQTVLGMQTNSTLTSTYLDLPLLWKLHFAFFQLGVGAYYSVPFSSRNPDYGTVAALGFTFGKILFEGRYKHGMHDTSRTADINKWQELQLLLGWVF